MVQQIEASIEIDAPVELVWDAINDPDVFVEGIDWVYEARWEDDGQIGVGSVYIERAKPGIWEATYRWQITEFEPPRRAVHSHSSGELEADLEVLLEPLNGQRTLYIQRMKFRALPAFRPLGVVLERTVMKRQMERDFEGMILPNYKQIIERRAGA